MDSQCSRTISSVASYFVIFMFFMVDMSVLRLELTILLVFQEPVKAGHSSAQLTPHIDQDRQQIGGAQAADAAGLAEGLRADPG
jgi:hypothetical protein